MQVFMSHSKDDQNGRDFFDKLFSSTEHRAFWYSWEGPKPPHAKSIRDAIEGSASVFVILSKPMEKPYTRSWVGYEVGIASGLNKNVWVFEPAWIKPDFVDVPVPFLTGYIQYPQKIDKKTIFPYISLVESAGTAIPKDPDPKSLPLFKLVTCPNKDCRAQYYRFVFGGNYKCPVCRGGIIPGEMQKPETKATPAPPSIHPPSRSTPS